MIAPTLEQLRLKLRELPPLVGGRFVRGDPDGVCTAITCDSRDVIPGAIFAALPGAIHHGEAFVQDALDRGAVALLGNRLTISPRRIPILEVDDPRAAMARIACALYNHPSLRLRTVGVTGTNGKTTVSFLVNELLRAAGAKPGWIGTLHYCTGNAILPAQRTTPEAPELQSLFHAMLQAQCDSVALEVSSHALAQQRVRGTQFDVAVFTNLTQDHLDYHRTMDAYFEAKAQLFIPHSFAEASTVRVINVDDPWGRKLALRLGSRLQMLTYGTRPEARVRAENIEMVDPGVRCRLITPWGEADIELKLIGRFNLLNALAAIAAGGALELPFDTMVQAIQRADAVPGRLQPIANHLGLRVYVDYAHTEDALAHVLRSLREITDRRIICVFGCGGDRDVTKRSGMGRAVQLGADTIIVTSDNPRSEDPNRIIDHVLEGMNDHSNVSTHVDRRAAIAAALAQATPEDVVLIAGKGHEAVQEIDGRFERFDDREVVRELLGGVPDGSSRPLTTGG